MQKRAGGVAQVVACLLSKGEALSSNPSTAEGPHSIAVVSGSWLVQAQRSCLLIFQVFGKPIITLLKII
jgi:hypothetical protein